MEIYRKDLLEIRVYGNRDEMGAAAAEDAAAQIRALLEKKDEINVVFAAAPSQNDFLAHLAGKDIDWKRVNAYHMDEYIGLGESDGRRFGNYLAGHIFNLVPFRSVHYIYREHMDAEETCEAYRRELEGIKIDMIFMGVGENGHIAFNDPHVADFNDPQRVKIVDLDSRCRTQQVNDGCFRTIDEVPEYAITLTVPEMMSADSLLVMVPTALKADAISAIWNGPVTEACPASVLRRHSHAVLYTDTDGASKMF